MKAIVKAAQEEGRLDLARGHIDDILLASSSRQELAKSVKAVVNRMAKANWPLNTKKSILEPTREIEFLGAVWKDDGTITRSKAASVLASKLALYARDRHLNEKELQCIRGYLGYYAAFAGSIHGIINPWLLEPLHCKRFLWPLIAAALGKEETRFRKTVETVVSVVTDASPSILAGVYAIDGEEHVYQRKLIHATDIKVADLKETS